jgi:16S rRNA (guanine966-N2)-methyltransferase
MAGKKSTGTPGSVRIISGHWRGRRVPVLPQADIRPTSERVRETLFNWLMPVVENSRCLDLFAGTGALGLEALSRGAAEAWFVDANVRAMDELENVIADFGIRGEISAEAGGATVVTSDALRFLERSPEPFDIVFLDPPFEGIDLENLCTLLEPGWLRPGSRIYLELSKRNSLPVLPRGWEIVREKTAGDVRFALVERSR